MFDRLIGTEKTEGLIQNADRARDAGNWSEAERWYDKALQSNPALAPIWVQYGHSLKEQGRFAEARTAYEQSLKLEPLNSDTHLQLGHVLKLLNARAEAARSYEEALRLGDNPDAFKELVGMGLESRARRIKAVSGRQAGKATYIDVSDILVYLTTHPTLSGIQRVQANLSRYICENASKERYSLVLGVGAELFAISHLAFVSMLDYLDEPVVEHSRLRAMIADVERTTAPVEQRAGDLYVILGAFWVTPDMIARCARFKNDGLIVAAYIYDIIPISHPEFCEGSLSRVFTLCFGDAFLSFDFVLTISEHTAREVRAFLKSHGRREIPVVAVPLAHTLSDDRIPSSRWTAAISALEHRPYVLCVSTVEARKNHALLFDIWRSLAALGVKVPNLVFVGRRGWRVDDLFAKFEATYYLGGTLHILHDLTDRELATLYQNARFTTLPSFVEGWGLPVGESLFYGKACVASETSSIPEIGGDLVQYIDPHNLTSARKTFQRMIEDDAFLKLQEDKIRTKYKPRLWSNVALQFVAELERLSEAVKPEPRPILPVFKRATIFSPGLYANDSRKPLSPDYARHPLRAMLLDGWYQCEGFGVWMKGDTGRLGFLSDAGDGEQVVVFLEMVGAPHIDHNRLTVSSAFEAKDNDGSRPGKTEAVFTSNSVHRLRLKAIVGEEGKVELTLCLAEPLVPNDNDPRSFGVGLLRLAYSPVNDVLSRQEILERLISS